MTTPHPEDRAIPAEAVEAAYQAVVRVRDDWPRNPRDADSYDVAEAALAAAMPLCVAAYRHRLLADLSAFIDRHGALTRDDVFEILTDDEPAALRSSVAAQTEET